MPVGTGNALIRERVVDLPTGSRGQSLIEMIRFAAANHLLVEIDYRDQQGNRSTRAIEAYSLRRSRAGDVLLMAVGADSGQPRSYLVDSILGVEPTQNAICAEIPDRADAIGPQSIRGRRGPLRETRSRRRRTYRSPFTCTQINPKHGFPGCKWSNICLQVHRLRKDLLQEEIRCDN